MKKIKDFFFFIIGSVLILFSIKLIYDGSEKYSYIISGVCFGILFIYPYFVKDSKTDSEKFVEKNNISLPVWWKRFLGFIIDFTIILFIYSITITSLFETRIDHIISPIILVSPFMILYYLIQESIFHTTIGKSIFKLTVILCENDKKLETVDVIVRSFSRLIPIDFIFFFTKNPIGLHDIISKTIVIEKKSSYFDSDKDH